MLWKFDYKFDRERLLQEAKNNLGYKGAISAAKENVYLDKKGRPTKDKISFERQLIKTKNIQKKSMPYADEIWKYFTNEDYKTLNLNGETISIENGNEVVLSSIFNKFFCFFDCVRTQIIWSISYSHLQG